MVDKMQNERNEGCHFTDEGWRNCKNCHVIFKSFQVIVKNSTMAPNRRSKNIPAIVAKLKIRNSYVVVVNAFLELDNALFEDPQDAAPKIARAQGAEAAIALMHQYPKDMPVQRLGSTIIYAVSTVNESFRKNIADKGGIERLFFALGNFMDDKGTRHNALRSLRCLVRTATSSIAEEIPVVLKAIGTYAEDYVAQEAACAFLSILAPIAADLAVSSSTENALSTPDACTLLLNAGCFPILVHSLKNSFNAPDNHDPSDQLAPMTLPISILLTFKYIIGHACRRIIFLRAC